MAENLRVAVAALVVGGVVGLVGPIVTWRAATWSQTQASLDQRRQDDLTEFRSVLDDALAKQDTLTLKVQLEMVAWETRSHATYQARHADADNAYANATAAADRVGVRLGFDASGYRLYQLAVSATFDASRWMYNHVFDTSTAGAMSASFNRGQAYALRFDMEAHRLAGSKLS